MKRRLGMKYFFAVITVLTSMLLVYAVDISGVWKGTVETAMGPLENTITLQVDGDKLTGSVKTDFFDTKIEKAAIKGDKVSFIVSMEYGTLTYEGTLAGEELKFTVIGPDGSPGELKTKRQK
jgi:hypothetical protein